MLFGSSFQKSCLPFSPPMDFFFPKGKWGWVGEDTEKAKKRYKGVFASARSNTAGNTSIGVWKWDYIRLVGECQMRRRKARREKWIYNQVTFQNDCQMNVCCFFFLDRELRRSKSFLLEKLKAFLFFFLAEARLEMEVQSLLIRYCKDDSTGKKEDKSLFLYPWKCGLVKSHSAFLKDQGTKCFFLSFSCKEKAMYK